VDIRRFFESVPQRSTYFSRDGWHPNDRGYGLVAKALFQSIQDHGLLEGRDLSPRNGHDK
jgi:lysophospholipase L1-like esterase